MINKQAAKGRHFVLTQRGYDVTRDEIKHERGVGEPMRGYEHNVPESWVKKGYVIEEWE